MICLAGSYYFEMDGRTRCLAVISYILLVIISCALNLQKSYCNAFDVMYINYSTPYQFFAVAATAYFGAKNYDYAITAFSTFLELMLRISASGCD